MNRDHIIQNVLYNKPIPATRWSIIIPDWVQILMFPTISLVEIITQLTIYNNENKSR